MTLFLLSCWTCAPAVLLLRCGMPMTRQGEPATQSSKSCKLFATPFAAMSKNWDNIFKSLAQRRAPTEEYKTTYDENTVTPADKQSFREWSNQDSFSSMQAKLTPPLKDALVKPFSRIIFHSTQHPVYIKRLKDMSHPTQLMIPLGRTTKAFYQLRPAPRGLRPDNEDRDEEYLRKYPHFDITDLLRIPSTVEKINAKNNDPTSRQTLQTLKKLGSLESAIRVPGAADDPIKYMFSRTGFFVVARIGLTGAANGLFIIHDKFPANYEEDFRPDVPEKETGILAYEDVAEISMAGLDGSCLLEDRNFSTPISWIGKVQSPIELVYVRQRTAGQGLVRLTVFDDFGGVDLEYD
ncbi:hypothetical protein IWX90DRAFT_416722 [Phyllosticta citrichinensis]|uniref:Uncharacterized protein n=1 Tax=Phyllosticta citrichinensis TaxID=1130410 RepID=A0ABR1XNJ3_9PEZI